MASYQVEGRKRHQETSPVQPNRLGLFVDIEVRLPPRRPLSAEIREHRGPVNPIPLRQLIDTRASKIVSLQLADPTASSLLVVVSVIMTPPALTGDGATYTVSLTDPKSRDVFGCLAFVSSTHGVMDVKSRCNRMPPASLTLFGGIGLKPLSRKLLCACGLLGAVMVYTSVTSCSIANCLHNLMNLR